MEETVTVEKVLDKFKAHSITKANKLFNPFRSDPGCREKINFRFCSASKCFTKILIKPVEAPQRSVKMKI